MDKLKMAFKLIGKRARQDRAAGKVPEFLGARGMLALMYDSITKFSEGDAEDTDYLLDLAVRSMFAFATTLPDDIDIEDDVDFGDDEPGPQEDTEEDDVDLSDERWSQVKPGQPVPTHNNETSKTL